MDDNPTLLQKSLSMNQKSTKRFQSHKTTVLSVLCNNSKALTIYFEDRGEQAQQAYMTCRNRTIGFGYLWTKYTIDLCEDVKGRAPMPMT